MKNAIRFKALVWRQLDGRWQWFVIVGILAFFNTAQDVTGCYKFLIEPAEVLMDVHEKDRKIRIRNWNGTLAVVHDCDPKVVDVVVDTRSGVITLSGDVGDKGLTGECTIWATDTLKDGKKNEAEAYVEVARLTMCATIFFPKMQDPGDIDEREHDFGNREVLKPYMEATVTVYGGVRPYSIIPWGRCSGILAISDVIREEEYETFTVRALGPPGECFINIEDKGWPADVLILNFEVQKTKPGSL